jgi:hypothetical protein
MVQRRDDGPKVPEPEGEFLGAPYDWRRPDAARFRSRWWNPDDPRFITPKALGWGFDVNLYWLFQRRKKR